MCCVLGISSCSVVNGMRTSNVDSGFAEAEVEALSHPPARAIVGMWFIKKPSYMTSILFRADGTGIVRHNLQGMGHGLKASQFRWSYDGAGWWSTRTDEMPTATNTRFRIAPGRLLQYFNYQDIPTRIIYTNAKDHSGLVPGDE